MINKSITNFTLKVGILGLSLASLVASGGAPGAGGALPIKHFTVDSDGINRKATLGSKEITITGSGENITIKRDGKTYAFASKDLASKEGEGKYYVLKAGDEEAVLQDLSKEYLESSANYKTDNSSIIYLEISNSDKKLFKTGYYITGSRTATLPTQNSPTYTGRLIGDAVNKASGGKAYVEGVASITPDFATQKIVGEFTDISTYDPETKQSQDLGYEVDLKQVTIANGGFKGQLGLSDNATQTLVTGVVEGGFYGTNAEELGGLGQIETQDFVTSFGFTAKK